VRGADAVQLRAQEIDEAAKIRIVVQHDPLGVHEVFRPWLRYAAVFVIALKHEDGKLTSDRLYAEKDGVKPPM
jgi:hypothetical protein